MNLIVCLDNRNGMMFGGRRQSRDKLLCERVMALTTGKLYMSEYSAKIFPESEKIVACGDYLTAAGKNDYCFCEEPPITLENSEKIIIYRWNRHYPADRHFHFDLEELGYELASTEEFIGNSHPTITEQIYKKVR
ncbi:MAG: ribonuclease Z [Clostridia bacterium]|nr:ribonuclease Z [Clostridia bacterium]